MHWRRQQISLLCRCVAFFFWKWAHTCHKHILELLTPVWWCRMTFFSCWLPWWIVVSELHWWRLFIVVTYALLRVKLVDWVDWTNSDQLFWNWKLAPGVYSKNQVQQTLGRNHKRFARLLRCIYALHTFGPKLAPFSANELHCKKSRIHKHQRW